MQTALVLMTKKINDKTTTYDLNRQPEKPNISNKNKLSPEIYLNFFNTIIWLQDNRRLKYTVMLCIKAWFSHCSRYKILQYSRMGFTATHFKDANDDKYFEIKIKLP